MPIFHRCLWWLWLGFPCCVDTKHLCHCCGPGLAFVDMAFPPTMLLGFCPSPLVAQLPLFACPCLSCPFLSASYISAICCSVPPETLLVGRCIPCLTPSLVLLWTSASGTWGSCVAALYTQPGVARLSLPKIWMILFLVVHTETTLAQHSARTQLVELAFRSLTE